MPKIYDSCLKSVSKSIKKGKMNKTYIDKEGKRVKSNPYAICSRLRSKSNKRR